MISNNGVPTHRPMTSGDVRRVKQMLWLSSLVLLAVGGLGVGAGVFGLLQRSFLALIWLLPAGVLGVLLLGIGVLKMCQAFQDLRHRKLCVAVGSLHTRRLVAGQSDRFVQVGRRRVYVSRQAEVEPGIVPESEVEVTYLPRSGAVLDVALPRHAGESLGPAN
jgi:hypothetical protein